MKKNYYQILQVDKEASIEIIEKAYKTLAKKYHPDLQTIYNKDSSEEMLKAINEAYETLSSKEKRYEYDQKLKENNTPIRTENKFNNYYTTNIQNKKNQKKSFNDYILDIFAALITIAILLLLLQIPFIKNLFIPHF